MISMKRYQRATNFDGLCQFASNVQICVLSDGPSQQFVQPTGTAQAYADEKKTECRKIEFWAVSVFINDSRKWRVS